MFHQNLVVSLYSIPISKFLSLKNSDVFKSPDAVITIIPVLYASRTGGDTYPDDDWDMISESLTLPAFESSKVSSPVTGSLYMRAEPGL